MAVPAAVPTAVPGTAAAGPAGRAPSPGAGAVASRRQRRAQRAVALLFLAPTLVGIGLFTLVPIVASFVLAFFRWDVISSPQFVGAANFTAAAADPSVRTAFANTAVFVVAAVALQLAVALGLAVLVQSRMPGWARSFFRSALFFPLVLSAASVSLVMAYLFNQDFGLVNAGLALVGVPAVPWLTEPAAAAVVVLLVYVWQNFGFSFLLFVGGLASIPRDVYEAAAVDGITGWALFRHITLPLLSPTVLVASVMAVISALQVFDQPYVLTRGGPGDSTRTVVMVIFESAFQRLDVGTASAVGIVLTLLILAVTAAQFALSRRYVHYL